MIPKFSKIIVFCVVVIFLDSANAYSDGDKIDVFYRPVSDLGYGSVYCGLYSFVSAATALECDVDCAGVFTGGRESVASSHLVSPWSFIAKTQSFNGRQA